MKRYIGLGNLFRVIKQHASEPFDRVEVAWGWLNDHHSGQWSDEYRDHCRLDFHAGNNWRNPHNYEAYNACCEAHGCTHEKMHP